MPLTPPGSNSSDYFEPDDPEFIQALQDAVLPGDVNAAESNVTRTPESRATLKRSRSPSEEAAFHRVPAGERGETGDEDDTYGRSHFGAWGEYMRRKRAKLQIQNNAQLEGEDDLERSRIFEGVSIYVCMMAAV